MSVEIVCNGEPRLVAEGTTVAGLVETLGLAGRPLAVERNQSVVPRREHANCVLQAGDQVELVTLVGGG